MPEYAKVNTKEEKKRNLNQTLTFIGELRTPKTKTTLSKVSATRSRINMIENER